MPLPQQDTVTAKSVPVRDSFRLKSDSTVPVTLQHSPDTFRHVIRIQNVSPLPVPVDTVSVCARNSIEDVTFYDSTSFIYNIGPARPDNFPYIFLKKNEIIAAAEKATLVKHLRTGSSIPDLPLHADWIIVIIVLVTILFTFVRKSSVNLVQGIERFFLFRGIRETPSKELGGLFSLESTIKNLVSFLIIGLFGYSAAAYYDIIPPGLKGLLFWIISISIVMAAVTLRHIVCLLIGIASGEREVFSEYLLGIYQFYRFSAIFIFVLTVFLLYTTVFPAKLCLVTAGVIIALLYLIRVTRLFIIFINRNISLFYLILYLCALEILPVVITVKYISGLV